MPELATRQEFGAIRAYPFVIAALKGPLPGKIAAQLAAEVVSHFALPKLYLKQPLSKGFQFSA